MQISNIYSEFDVFGKDYTKNRFVYEHTDSLFFGLIIQKKLKSHAFHTHLNTATYHYTVALNL